MTDQIPACIEAEEAILGGIIFDSKAIDLIKDWLPVQAFYVSKHQKIYQACLHLRNKGEKSDYIALCDWFSSRQLLDEIGGTAQLSKLLNRTISAANIERYGKLILDKYHRRQLIALGHSIVQIGYNPCLEIDEAYQEVRSLLPENIFDNQSLKPLPQIKTAKYRITNPKNPSESIELDIDIEQVLLVEESLLELKTKAQAIANKLWGA